MKTLLEDIGNHSFPLDFPGHYIGNKWVRPSKSAETRDSLNPSTGEILMSVGLEKQQIDLALKVSEKVMPHLQEASYSIRFEYINKLRQALGDHQTDIINVLRIESGKPLWEAQYEFSQALLYLDQFLANQKVFQESLYSPYKAFCSTDEIRHRSVGTALAYVPFSTALPGFVQYLAAALISGSPIIILASRHVSLFSVIMGSVLEELEFPLGSVNILFGGFTDFQAISHQRSVRAVFYRGSREHCMTLHEDGRNHWGRVIDFSSGGKNSALCLPNAPIDKAVECICLGALMSAGQLCESTSRVFVHRESLADLVNQMVAKIKGLKIGPTHLDDDVEMGPLYSSKAVDKFLRFQTMAKKESDNTVLWGKSLEIGSGGNFVTPGVHIFNKFDGRSAYQSNVLLFPDIAIYEYDTVDEAVAKINSTDAAYSVSVIGGEAEFKKSLHFRSPNLIYNGATVESAGSFSLPGSGYSSSSYTQEWGLASRLLTPVSVSNIRDNSSLFNAWLKR